MEPANLTPPDPDELDLLLRRDASLPPLADDGFSARVVAALPPPRRRTWLSRRVVLCLAGALAGAAFSLRSGVEWPTTAQMLGRIGDAAFGASQFLANPVQFAIVVVVAASIAFAFLSGRDRPTEDRF